MGRRVRPRAATRPARRRAKPSSPAMLNAEFVYHTDSAFFMFMGLKTPIFL